MKKFWSYISNGKYSVGTTGQTVYLYDENGNEIGKFKDIIYAYTPMFSPDGKIFVVKSSDGRLAVYSLENRALIKKFRFSKVDGAQDEGFCFSPDGKYFINLETHGDGLQWAISVYDTADFSRVSRLLLEEKISVSYIEFDDITNEYYCLVNDAECRCFVAKYKNNTVVDMLEITEKEWDFYSSYLRLKMSGFTEKQYEWSYIDCELNELKEMNHSLAKLYNHYNNSNSED